MSFAGSFSIAPNPLDPTSFSITDTSAGSDTNITDRQIFAYLVNGGTLTIPGTTTPYIDWPVGAQSPFPITGLLTQDYSINFVVNWISSDPISGSTYTSSLLYTFTGNTQTFINSLLQSVAAQQSLLNDQEFQANLYRLFNEVNNAQNAQAFNQQGNAQNALNRALLLIQNKSLCF